ncbi:MAG: TIGR02452 family protein [Lachnospiraceae bacterium]|nr:TIGR02452 family protein [Lachnospiraceae bacterium]
MHDRREINAEIFKDTEYMYKSNEKLKNAVSNSLREQRMILETEEVSVSSIEPRKGKIVVFGKRTLEASEIYAKQGKKVCVLNFASATSPGGGVVHGSSAQEEAICRCSILYPCLNQKNMWEQFYIPHRTADNPLYNDDCIFTPRVMVFKSDTNFPKLLQESEWWTVDVITCAAPNLRRVPSNMMNPGGGSSRAEISYEGLRILLQNRIRRIFEVAAASGAEVLILGAFGCGAFRNPPKLVAEVFAELTEQYRECFEVIEYAVFHMEHEKANYEAFKDAMRCFAECSGNVSK